jgi:tRNA pseudouridine13 synthase
MNRPVTSTLAYLTPDIPGIGGRIKLRPDDFLVDEQPLYPPDGEGEHLYLFIEKRGQTTSDVVRRLAKLFAVKRDAVGYAGLKDKQAVTRQHFSIHLPQGRDQDKALARIEHTPFKLLWAARHRNKLRRGHLAGNRFVIYIREVQPTAVLGARRVLDRLVAHGAPNYIGEQRFGYRQNNHILGRLMLQGQWQAMLDAMLGQPSSADVPVVAAAREHYSRQDYRAALEAWPRHFRHDRQALDLLRQGRSARDAVLGIDLDQRVFLLTALQSAVFNAVLDRRVRDGRLHQLIEGDLAWKHDSRAVFAVDAAIAQAENAPGGRVARMEVSPSGPMWGHGMMRAAAAAGQWELDALQAQGLNEADFPGPQELGITASGARRPMRLAIRDAEVSGGVDEQGAYVRVAFELERGAFATVVLREIMKNDAAQAGEESPEA